MKDIILAHLESCFPSFETSLRQEIADIGKLIEVPADTLMMDIGQQVEIIPLIVSGQIKVFREDDQDHEIFLYYLSSGEACAITLICSARTGYSKIKAIPEENSQIISVPISKLDEWMGKYPTWYYFVMDTYQARFEELLKVVDGIAFHQMDERLVEYLRKNADVSHSRLVHKTHQQIAHELNSSREVVSRLLKKLEQRGVVRVNRNQIELLRILQHIHPE